MIFPQTVMMIEMKEIEIDNLICKATPRNLDGKGIREAEKP